MELLKKKILEEGYCIGDSILKVDSFLNAQVDIELMNEIGKEFKSLFKDAIVTKILTAEASGIAIAAITAQYFNCPIIIAKKYLSVNMDVENYEAQVYSFTKKKEYVMRVSKKHLTKEDNVLIIDDFLANGLASMGLINMVELSGANLVGIGIVVEKTFQEGRKLLEDKNIRIESLARIKSLKSGNIEFLE